VLSKHIETHEKKPAKKYPIVKVAPLESCLVFQHPVIYQRLMRIGSYDIPHSVFAAPMAGVTDRPYRILAKQLGAAYAVSEMVTAREDLRHSLKTSRRLDHTGESGPIAVQIAGTEPDMMAQAAAYNLQRGAQIIDINMGCPAKKVCNKWAGSALMQDESLALSIIEAVVNAARPYEAPVTLKMRTGWQSDQRNAVSLARKAESAGIQMITVHGRTRDQGYKGQAEYDTIAEVKKNVSVPVVANGDIDTPAKALMVMEHTGVDAVMIGRAAQGRPWLFREIHHFLTHGTLLAPPLVAEVKRLLLQHLQDHYSLYGSYTGVRTARKHIGWYVQGLPGATEFKKHLNAIEDCQKQFLAVADFWDALGQQADRLTYVLPVTDTETIE
jgi:tRNA-dihydrouridine synthase B